MRLVMAVMAVGALACAGTLPALGDVSVEVRTDDERVDRALDKAADATDRALDTADDAVDRALRKAAEAVGIALDKASEAMEKAGGAVEPTGERIQVEVEVRE